MAQLDVKTLLAHLVEDGGTIVVTTSEFSVLPVTVTNSKIRSEHVVVNEVLTNPAVQIEDWKVTTADGSLTIDAITPNNRARAINGTTGITLYLNPTTSYGKSGTIKVDITGVSELPYTHNDARITPNHVVIKSVLSRPEAQLADWTVNTSTGSLTISSNSNNAISGTTNVTLYLTTHNQLS